VSTKVHRAAVTGFGRAARSYERSRPDYPAEAIDRLVQELEIGRTCSLLDLGAGTGKLTRMLVSTGATITALEPVQAMRDALAEGVPEASVLAATAEAIPVADATFDAVVCGQAFHWFDGERALAEVYRVLRPHGRLALLWNQRDESVDWERRLTEIIAPYEGGTPSERTGEWRRAFSATDLFGTLHQLRFQHRQELDTEGLVDRMASVSFIALLPERERAAVLDEVRELARSHPDLAGRERFELHYITDLYWCVRS
jgi:ubiquinone/menaquinone biosynthesis C-methylase UbiE